MSFRCDDSIHEVSSLKIDLKMNKLGKLTKETLNHMMHETVSGEIMPFAIATNIMSRKTWEKSHEAITLVREVLMKEASEVIKVMIGEESLRCYTITKTKDDLIIPDYPKANYINMISTVEPLGSAVYQENAMRSLEQCIGCLLESSAIVAIQVYNQWTKYDERTAKKSFGKKNSIFLRVIYQTSPGPALKVLEQNYLVNKGPLICESYTKQNRIFSQQFAHENKPNVPISVTQTVLVPCLFANGKVFYPGIHDYGIKKTSVVGHQERSEKQQKFLKEQLEIDGKKTKGIQYYRKVLDDAEMSYPARASRETLETLVNEKRRKALIESLRFYEKMDLYSIEVHNDLSLEECAEQFRRIEDFACDFSWMTMSRLTRSDFAEEFKEHIKRKLWKLDTLRFGEEVKEIEKEIKEAEKRNEETFIKSLSKFTFTAEGHECKEYTNPTKTMSPIEKQDKILINDMRQTTEPQILVAIPAHANAENDSNEYAVWLHWELEGQLVESPFKKDGTAVLFLANMILSRAKLEKSIDISKLKRKIQLARMNSPTL